MRTLSIDIETFSSVDLAKGGVYRYCEAPDFEVTLFGYAADGGAVRVIDLTGGEAIPADVLSALTDDAITKWAFNSSFERVCLSRHLGMPTGEYLSPAGWRCTMVWSAYMGLPLSLAAAGAALGIERQKLTEGKELIRYFCVPRRNATLTVQVSLPGLGGDTLRNLPEHAPDKWVRFKEYNCRDVEAEMSIQRMLSRFPVPDSVWDEYVQDQEINDRGVALDMELVRSAIGMDERSRAELTRRMKLLTGVDNPNSVQQMKSWLAENGLKADSLGKEAVAEMMKDVPEPLRDVLVLRQQMAKSSVRKYKAMEAAVCSDGRARGMFQFFGSRTGRWAGRRIQLQNLPQNHLPDLTDARALARSGDADALGLLYGSVPETLSELVRTAFVAPQDKRLVVADFSAIEARVIAWLAGERWKQDVFAGDGKIYEATAARMFNVPIETVTKGSVLRQKAKQAELACGYGGSVGALKAMGALDMGLTVDELQPLVSAWRSANPNIVRLWWDVDAAAKATVKGRTATETHGIRFSFECGMLFVTLPSGRRLAYVKPRIGVNRFGGECVTYKGIGQTKKWERIETYGPKLVENIVQATSRDILSHAMRSLRHLPIVMHIHDEIVIEADSDVSVSDVCTAMERTPMWAKDLLLKADGYETGFYKKD
jgi:DNA polymerase